MLGSFCSSQAFLSTRERTLLRTLINGNKDAVITLMPYRLAFAETSKVGLTTDDVVISDVNPAAEELFGFSEDELTNSGKRGLDLIVDKKDETSDSRADHGALWLIRRINDVIKATAEGQEAIRLSSMQQRMNLKSKSGSVFEASVEVHAVEHVFTGAERLCRPGLMLVIRPRAQSIELFDQFRGSMLRRSSSIPVDYNPSKARNAVSDLQQRFKTIFEGACSAVGKGFFDILLENLGAWSNFEYGFIASAVSSAGKNEEGHHKVLKVMSFWDRKIGINSEFANVPYESDGTPCSLTFKENTVLIPSGLNEAYPDFGFFKILKPPPRCYIALSISDTVTGEFLGNIGLMDVTANPEELVNPEYIKLGMRVFAERVGAELKRLQIEEDLTSARELADNATAAKTQFLNHMSHEIRTPMNAVIGMTELLLDTPLDDEQLELVSTVRSSGQHLLQVINNTLDFSKIEAGSLVLDQKPLSVRDLIKEAIDLIKPSDLGLASSPASAGGGVEKKKRKPVVFRSEIAEDVPALIIGDVTRLRQVLINIGANAYNEGSISVSCRVEAPINKDGKVMMKFTITDTGLGIPKTSWSKLFQPFVQLDSTSCRNYQGSGLGLSIAYHLVELMGGRIWVENSILGEGSTISFTMLTIPCDLNVSAVTGTFGLIPSPSGSEMRLEFTQEAAAPFPSLKRGDKPEWDPELASRLGYHIMVAEDNPINAKMVKTMFGKLGFKQIDHAVDGEKAVAMVRESYESRPYDVIFTDLLMPNMDGYAATKAMNKWFEEMEATAQRGGTTFKRPKIIGLSANASVEDRDICLGLGMTEYLTKPVTIKDLQGALLRLEKLDRARSD
ncbi:hypothetical protein HK097_007656 [Rhizophlyctis rosea]|uniref:histidine kinase n=1 Tax=Rhizophlyctis rosea TaxID=64517 RepID=A0AAD5SEF6_9FUNG|nr:hypothetical protein HK097_007656 [Rhizophlyctis rosea]